MLRETHRVRTAFVLALLLAIVAGGAFLRLYEIGAKSLWLDETASMELAGRPLFSLVSAVAERDTHPPLYYILLRAWLWGSGSAARARAFSAAVGAATLLVYYALARRLVSRPAALVSVLLLAASAYQVYFAQEARHYVLATFFVSLSWFFLVELVAGKRLERWPMWLGLAASNTAALYTFYYTAFAIAGQLVVLILLWRGVGRKLLVPWIVWQLLPAGLFAFYLPVIQERLGSLRRVVAPGAYAMGLGDLWTTAAEFAGGFLAELVRGHEAAARAAAAVPALLALAVGLAGLRRMRTAAAVGLVWLLLPVAIVAFFPFKGHVYEPKHIIFAAPALFLLVGLGLTAIPGKLKAVPAAVALLLLGLNAVSLVRYFDPRVEKENWRDAISRLLQTAEPNDILVLNPRYATLPYLYYTGPARTGRDRPPFHVIEAPVAGDPFRGGELGLGRRTWVLEAASNVSTPNPDVDRALAGYPVLFHEEYHDLVGSIRLILYDTRTPPGKAKGPGPK